MLYTIIILYIYWNDCVVVLHSFRFGSMTSTVFSNGIWSTLVSGINKVIQITIFYWKKMKNYREKGTNIARPMFPRNNIFLSRVWNYNFQIICIWIYCVSFFFWIQLWKIVIIDGGWVLVGTYRQIQPTFPFLRFRMLMKLQ